MNLSRMFAAALLVLSIGAAALGDVLEDYQKRYKKEAITDRKAVLAELAATGKPEALKALQWCVTASKGMREDSRKDADKARAKLAPIEDKIAEKYKAYREQQKKQGNPDPDPRTYPHLAEEDEELPLRAEISRAESAMANEDVILTIALDSEGALIAKLPAEAQKAVRDDWTKTRLSSKDWGVRVECYEMLGHTRTDWATDTLVAAAGDSGEFDPRVLVVVIDGLGGREPKRVLQPLLVRLDDTRWTVRAAVVAALEKTPAKEAIDGLVKRIAKEDGRLRDDCARALRALTGAKIESNADMWRLYWEKNRESWAGKPPPDKPLTPFMTDDEAARPKGQTGFFGITIESKRVVFVIDVSGSMKWAMGGNGPDAKNPRAVVAKRELKQAIAGLADDAIFDIIMFSSGVTLWKPDMQKADVKGRKEAQEFVDAAEIVGGTNTFDALEAAFNLGDVGKGKRREAEPTGDARVDTIVFLSDGKPSVGKTIDVDAIRAAVRDWNKARRVAIHSVALGSESKQDANPMARADPKFMEGLATDSGGSYRAP